MRFKVHPSQPAGFRSLARYLPGRDPSNTSERVAWSYVRNLPSDDPEIAARIMEGCASQSRRCKKPAYHFIITFDPNDTAAGKVDAEAMREMSEEVIERMGLSEYQALIYAHHDTKHHHIHFLVNRVHPKTLKAYSRHEDGKRLHAICRAIAKERGLNVARDLVEEQALSREDERAEALARAAEREPEQQEETRAAERSPERGPREGEYWQARREQRRPLERFADADVKTTREIFLQGLEGAESWDDLSKRLADHKLYLARKGQGLIISDGERYAKLSEMGKGVRLKGLEEQFRESFTAFAAKDAHWMKRARGRGAVMALDDADDEFRYWSMLQQTYRHAEGAVSYAQRQEDGANQRRQQGDKNYRERLEFYLMGLTLIYRNGRGALRKWEELVHAHGFAEADAMVELKPALLGKLRGVEDFGGTNQERDQAKAMLKRMARVRGRFIRAQKQMEASHIQLKEARRRLQAVRHSYAMLELRLGKSEYFRKIMLDKIKQRAVALDRVTEKMINQAELAEERRLQLVQTYRTHKRNKERAREREQARGIVRGR